MLMPTCKRETVNMPIAVCRQLPECLRDACRQLCVILIVGLASVQVSVAGETDEAAKQPPGQGDSCVASPHACSPEATLDCVRFPDKSICGTNHIWLNVAHNRLSLPLSSAKSPCDARFADLNVAKWTCQSDADCRGITRDHGVTCGGVLRTYELRRGVLWDTTPDTAFNSWVKKEFWRRSDTDLVIGLTGAVDDPCMYRFDDVDSAKRACLLTEGCHGVVKDSGIRCGGKLTTYDLRNGGQTGAPGVTAWIYRVRPVSE